MEPLICSLGGGGAEAGRRGGAERPLEAGILGWELKLRSAAQQMLCLGLAKRDLCPFLPPCVNITEQRGCRKQRQRLQIHSIGNVTDAQLMLPIGHF